VSSSSGYGGYYGSSGGNNYDDYGGDFSSYSEEGEEEGMVVMLSPDIVTTMMMTGGGMQQEEGIVEGNYFYYHQYPMEVEEVGYDLDRDGIVAEEGEKVVNTGEYYDHVVAPPRASSYPGVAPLVTTTTTNTNTALNHYDNGDDYRKMAANTTSLYDRFAYDKKDLHEEWCGTSSSSSIGSMWTVEVAAPPARTLTTTMTTKAIMPITFPPLAY